MFLSHAINPMMVFRNSYFLVDFHQTSLSKIFKDILSYQIVIEPQENFLFYLDKLHYGRYTTMNNEDFMKKSVSQFRKEKKDEKRAQAKRQIELAYKNCKERQTEDGEPIFGLIIGDKFVEWRIRMQPEMEEIYSTIDIVKALNIPRERLKDWMTQGFIRPSLPATGIGTIAIFTRIDVYAVALFKKLLGRGFKRKVAAQYISLFASQKAAAESLNYILFWSSAHEQERRMNANFIFGKSPMKFEINKSGYFKWTYESLSPGVIEIWDDIHIVNVMNLRKEVDTLLAKLE